jgi:hypothetical protein
VKLQSGRLIVLQQRWIFLLVLVVVLYLVVHITRAQEVVTTPEPTAVPADISLATQVPTDELVLEDTNLTATPLPPLSIETPTPQMDLPAAILIPMGELTLEATDVIDLSVTPITPESTLLPTDAPISTLVPMDEAAVTSVPIDLDTAASATDIPENMMLTPVAEMELTLMPETTEELTETPVVISVISTLSDQFHISGQIQANIPLRQVTLIIREMVTHQVVAVQDNGTFSADLPAGDYQFIFTALYCLPRVIPLTIADKPVRLPIVTLIGGDIDQNGIIDMGDAIFIAQNFGLAASLTSSSVDLNVDGIVDIYDLALVSANIHPNQ